MNYEYIRWLMKAVSTLLCATASVNRKLTASYRVPGGANPRQTSRTINVSQATRILLPSSPQCRTPQPLL